ncbi:MAG: glycosyltransferase family 2 protein [Clostridiaceae bacterium]|nr:glycosyltransferase family 2 protein [Clostridiaceae bacterium]
MKHSVLIIIPAYNEEASIGDFLSDLLNSSVTEYADITVINDASRDATASIAVGMGIPVISHPFNLGYGTALQTGYKYAVTKKYDYLIQIDADGQHDICNIDRIYKKLTETEKKPDLVIGTRFLKDSQSFSIPFPKKIAIRFFRKIIQITGKQKISDPTSGLQGMNRQTFEYYSHFGNFDNNYPDANMIVQMALLGYDIQEIPAVMHERKAGKSMHFGIIEPILYMLIMMFSTMNVFLRNRKKRQRHETKQKH